MGCAFGGVFASVRVVIGLFRGFKSKFGTKFQHFFS